MFCRIAVRLSPVRSSRAYSGVVPVNTGLSRGRLSRLRRRLELFLLRLLSVTLRDLLLDLLLCLLLCLRRLGLRLRVLLFRLERSRDLLDWPRFFGASSDFLSSGFPLAAELLASALGGAATATGATATFAFAVGGRRSAMSGGTSV